MPKLKTKQIFPSGKRKTKTGTKTRTVPDKHGQKKKDGPTHNPTGGLAKGTIIGAEYRWKPGQSGNPKGRPKGLDMTNSLRRILELPAQGVPFIKTKAIDLGMDIEDKSVLVVDVLMTSGLVHSISGKSDIFKQVWERIEGAIPKDLRISEDDPVMEYLDFMRDMTEPPAPEGTNGNPVKEVTTLPKTNGRKKARITKKNGKKKC